MRYPRKELLELVGKLMLISLAIAGILCLILNTVLSRGTYAPGMSHMGLDRAGAPHHMLTIGLVPVGLIVGLALLFGAFAARGGISVLLFPLSAGFLLTGIGQAWLLMSGWQLFLVIWVVSLTGAVIVYWHVK